MLQISKVIRCLKWQIWLLEDFALSCGIFPDTVVVRSAQIHNLNADAASRFVAEMMTHFQQLWPAKVSQLGSGYRDWIQEGVASAASHGIVAQRGTARFINLWFVWGQHFEKQAGFEWARDILADPKRAEYVKTHQLFYRTRQELEILKAKI
jgi:hypothetical protein